MLCKSSQINLYFNRWSPQLLTGNYKPDRKPEKANSLVVLAGSYGIISGVREWSISRMLARSTVRMRNF